MVGAGSVAAIWVMVSIWYCWGSLDHIICSGLVETGGQGGIPFVALLVTFFAQHTLTKCPILLQWWQICSYAGHQVQLPTCGFDPHPGQIASCWLCWVAGGCQGCLTAKTALGLAPFILLCCFLAASCALHIVMIASSVRSGCFKRCSMSSPSREPTMIWSCMLFCVHCSRQKLHVLSSSRQETKKSSNSHQVAVCDGVNYVALLIHQCDHQYGALLLL